MKWKGTKNTDKDEKHKRTPRGKGQLYVKSDMIKCKRLEMRPLNHHFTKRPLEYIVHVTGTTYEFSTGHGGSLKRRKITTISRWSELKDKHTEMLNTTLVKNIIKY